MIPHACARDISPYARAAFLALWLIARVACGQEGAQVGKVTGTVRESNRYGLSGALVTLSGPDRNQRETVLSGEGGSYSFPSVQYGDYSLTVALTGFELSIPEKIRIASPVTVVNFTLRALPNDGKVRGAAGEEPSDTERKTPTFRHSGMQGDAAPSGYASGVDASETSAIMQAKDLSEILLSLISVHKPFDCNREGDLLRAASANPASPEAQHMAGVFYLEHRDPQKSLQFLKRAADLEPRDVGSLRDLALAYLMTAQYPEATQLTQRGLELAPNDPELHAVLGASLAAEGKSKAAMAEYGLSCKLDPPEEDLLLFGMALVQLGGSEEALGAFAAGIERHPEWAKLWLGKGIVESVQHQKRNSIQSLLKAVDLDPNYSLPYLLLANLSGAEDEWNDRILNMLKRFAASRPNDAEAHYSYALSLFKREAREPNIAETREIESQLRMAIARDPGLASAHFLLGVIYTRSGRDAQAIDELRATSKLRPNSAETHYRLAQVYRKTGQMNLAEVELKNFAALPVSGSQEDLEKVDVRSSAEQILYYDGSLAACAR